MSQLSRILSRATHALRPLALSCVLGALAACGQLQGLSLPMSGSGVDATRQVTVALLAPFGSEKSEQNFLGTSLVNAARLAQQDMPGVSLDLRIYPTAGTPEQAASAAQQALAEGAQVIVGPFYSTSTAAVAPLAGGRGVQVLSFSNNPQVAGGNVHLLGMTFETIANRVVGYASAQGKRAVGVIHSNDPGGMAGLAAAQAAITRYGAEFVGASGYELSPKGVSTAAPVIAQTMRGAGANAVVLTDDPGSGLTFLTPMLANYGLKSPNPTFLGLTRWNVPPEAASTPSMQGGVFAGPDPQAQANFEARYTAAYGNAPHKLASLAYDGVAAVGAMVQSARASGSGTALTEEQLTQSAGFQGATGIFRFNPDGTSDRGLSLFRLQNGAAVVIDPAPRSFAAPVL